MRVPRKLIVRCANKEEDQTKRQSLLKKPVKRYYPFLRTGEKVFVILTVGVVHVIGPNPTQSSKISIFQG